MTTLLQFDYELFYLINSGWANPVYDAVLPLLRNKYTWFPLYLFLLVFLLENFRWKGSLLVLALALTVGCADFTSSQLIKKTVQRPRPCHTLQAPQELQLRVRCGSGFSFPSTHAANHFAMATLLALGLGRRWRWVPILALVWAFLVAFSQIYVGVHYPLDAVAGALLGSAIAGLVWFCFQQLAALSSRDFL